MNSLYTASAVQADVWPVFPKRQGPPEPENMQKNLQRVIELIERLADWNPSKLYVLPEFFLTGAGSVGQSSENRELLCVRIPGPEIDQLCALAKRIGAYICGMAWEVMDDWPNRYWNTAFICSPQGEVILKYHKHYDLTGKTSPSDVLTEYLERYGEAALFPVVETEIGRLGCLTCYDINFPEMARCLALQGAEIILHPTSEGRAPFLLEDQGGWEIGKRSRAYENLAYVISANQGRFRDCDFPSDRMRGRSQIIDYTGRVTAIAETTGEAILQAEINLEALRQRRSQLQLNFLAQLKTHVHAPFYANQERWPTELWMAEPPPGDLANIKSGAKVIKQLQEEGRLIPPVSGQSKKSFV